MKERVAVVTGAASGIGKATAMLLAARGADVALLDKDGRQGPALSSKIARETGKRAVFIRTDVSKGVDVRRAVDKVVGSLGLPQILVNDAAIFRSGTVVSTEESQWDEVLAVNLKGVYLCSKYVIPHMVRAGSGVIVNIASAVALIGRPGHDAYTASKGAVLALSRAMALEWAKKGIRVVCVCPGVTETPMIQRLINETPNPKGIRETLTKDAILGRFGKPREVAQMIVFLVSDEASYVTGAVICVDGGETAGLPYHEPLHQAEAGK